MYLVGFPNLLVSLHPDYVMTHLMTPWRVGRRSCRVRVGVPSEVAEKADFDPSFAVDFWDLTNRQDSAACESVPRGFLSSTADATARAAGAGKRTASISSSAGWLGRDLRRALLAGRDAVGSLDRLRVSAHPEGDTGAHHG